MRRSGHVVREVLDHLRDMVAPGISTMDLERAAEKKIKESGAKPAFKGYFDYPCVLCTSINEEIVHGIPSEKRVLKAGDIVSIDCGVVMDGYYGDAAITVPVDESADTGVQKLLEVTEASLYKGIEQVRVGIRSAMWARRFRNLLKPTAFSVVREFVGHGIGTRLARRAADSELRVARSRGDDCGRAWSWRSSRWSTSASPEAAGLDDKWTAVTADGSLQRSLRALCGRDAETARDFDADSS